MIRKVLAHTVLLLCFLLMSGKPLPGGELGQLSETQAKVAYLFNFAKYAEWPASALPPASPLVVGIFGKGFAAEAQGVLAGKQIRGHRVQVRVCARPEEIPGCHLLFISSSERTRLKEILKGVPAAGVLTVSDVRNFSRLGGMIGLVLKGERLQFEIDQANAERAGLKLSSQLLKLALTVFE